MDVNRRTASGTLAELLGPAACRPTSSCARSASGARRSVRWRVISPDVARGAGGLCRRRQRLRREPARCRPSTPVLEISNSSRGPRSTAWRSRSPSPSSSRSTSRTSPTLSRCRRIRRCSGPRGQPPVQRRPLARPSRSISLHRPGCARWLRSPRSLGTRGWTAGGAGAAAALGKKYADRVRDMPFFKDRMSLDKRPAPTSGPSRDATRRRPAPPRQRSAPVSRRPSTFYPIGLAARRADVEGERFAGVPGVIIGHNRYIAWGATMNPLDVTDIYQEKVVPDATSPSGLSTVHLGVARARPADPRDVPVQRHRDGVSTTVVGPDGVPSRRHPDRAAAQQGTHRATGPRAPVGA